MANSTKPGKNAEIGNLLSVLRPTAPVAPPAPPVPAAEPVSAPAPTAPQEPVKARAPIVPKAPSARVIIQEAKVAKKIGRPSSASTTGVESVKVSPSIPLALKRKVDRALAEDLAGEFPTFNDFATAAFRQLLLAKKQPTDLT